MLDFLIHLVQSYELFMLSHPVFFALSLFFVCLSILYLSVQSSKQDILLSDRVEYLEREVEILNDRLDGKL